MPYTLGGRTPYTDGEFSRAGIPLFDINTSGSGVVSYDADTDQFVTRTDRYDFYDSSGSLFGYIDTNGLSVDTIHSKTLGTPVTISSDNEFIVDDGGISTYFKADSTGMYFNRIKPRIGNTFVVDDAFDYFKIGTGASDTYFYNNTLYNCNINSASQIPNLDASKITSGTLDNNRLNTQRPFTRLYLNGLPPSTYAYFQSDGFAFMDVDYNDYCYISELDGLKINTISPFSGTDVAINNNLKVDVIKPNATTKIQLGSSASYSPYINDTTYDIHLGVVRARTTNLNFYADNFNVFPLAGGASKFSVNSLGVVNATDGSGIQNLNASYIASGTIDNARLPPTISVDTLVGDGSGITDLNATEIKSGTLDNARLPYILTRPILATYAMVSSVGVSYGGSTIGGNLDVIGDSIYFKGDGATPTYARIDSTNLTLYNGLRLNGASYDIEWNATSPASIESLDRWKIGGILSYPPSGSTAIPLVGKPAVGQSQIMSLFTSGGAEVLYATETFTKSFVDMGINTTPSYALDVRGQLNVRFNDTSHGFRTWGDSFVADQYLVGTTNSTVGNPYLRWRPSSGATHGKIEVWGWSSEADFCLGDGNLGVGTTTPSRALHVANGGVKLLYGSTEYLMDNGATYEVSTDIVKRATTHSFKSTNDTTYFARLNATGLCVGTTTPRQKLDVVGNMLINWSGGEIIADGTAYFPTNVPFSVISNPTSGVLTLGLQNSSTSGAPASLGFFREDSVGNSKLVAGIYAIDGTDTLNAFNGGLDLRVALTGNSAGYNPLTTALRINSYGNVGINQTNPTYRLEVVGNTKVGSIRIAGGGTYESGCIYTDSNWGQLYRGIGTETLAEFAWFNSAGTERMRMVNGNLGIGKTGPLAKLEVAGGSNSTASAPGRYFRHSIGLTYSATNTDFGVSIFADDDIVSKDYIVSHNGNMTASDERIKENIEDISDTEALDKLRLLKPKTYTYKDTIGRGSEKVMGFIAQEVEEVLPLATGKRYDAIPNIYELANVSASNVITFTNFNTSNLTANTMIDAKTETSGDMRLTIEEILDEHSIKVKEDIEGEQVFVMGEYVDDFTFLKKDHIWTVATSALQEVDRQQQADKARISALESIVETLMAEIADLKSHHITNE